MATYTNSGGLTKPATGEFSGTWGTITNTNFDIIDRLVNGVASIPLTSTPYALATSDGALSVGQYLLINFSGSIGGTVTVNVTPQDATKIYFIRNSSNSSLVISQGSGSTVTIASGYSKLVYTDGAGSTASVFDFTSILSMSGVQITGGAITGVTISGITDLAVADGGTGASTAAAALVNFGLTATATEINYTSGVTSAIQTQLGNKIPNNSDAALTGGYTTTADADGTFSSGTYTPVPSGGNMKTITNGGAFTLAAPTATGDYTLIIRMVNNATAGAVTLSGFNKSGGDTLTTTNGNAFFLYITKCGGSVALIVQALQ